MIYFCFALNAHEFIDGVGDAVAVSLQMIFHKGGSLCNAEFPDQLTFITFCKQATTDPKLDVLLLSNRAFIFL